jgi:hypothetical protein
MLARADIRAVDTAPHQLRVSTRVGRLPAVAVHDVVVGAAPVPTPAQVRVELRVLAASHQVVVLGDDDIADHVETVACDLAAPSASPLVDGGRYGDADRPWSGVASVEQLDADGFGREAQRWIDRAQTDDERCIAVVFPNHPQAITALVADVEGGALLGWTGAHLYPSAGGGGAVVRTTTRRTPAVAVRAVHPQEVPA